MQRSNCVYTELISTEIDRKSLGQPCFIDLQEAFDTLDHKTLLQKMEKFILGGPIYDMMKSYLSDRWQYADMNGKETSKTDHNRCFTRILPFLFLLYIKNLDSSSGNSKVSMFADDTTILKAKK